MDALAVDGRGELWHQRVPVADFMLLTAQPTKQFRVQVTVANTTMQHCLGAVQEDAAGVKVAWCYADEGAHDCARYCSMWTPLPDGATIDIVDNRDNSTYRFGSIESAARASGWLFEDASLAPVVLASFKTGEDGPPSQAIPPEPPGTDNDGMNDDWVEAMPDLYRRFLDQRLTRDPMFSQYLREFVVLNGAKVRFSAPEMDPDGNFDLKDDMHLGEHVETRILAMEQAALPVHLAESPGFIPESPGFFPESPGSFPELGFESERVPVTEMDGLDDLAAFLQTDPFFDSYGSHFDQPSPTPEEPALDAPPNLNAFGSSSVVSGSGGLPHFPIALPVKPGPAPFLQPNPAPYMQPGPAPFMQPGPAPYMQPNPAPRRRGRPPKSLNGDGVAKLPKATTVRKKTRGEPQVPNTGRSVVLLVAYCTNPDPDAVEWLQEWLQSVPDTCALQCKNYEDTSCLIKVGVQARGTGVFNRAKTLNVLAGMLPEPLQSNATLVLVRNQSPVEKVNVDDYLRSVEPYHARVTGDGSIVISIKTFLAVDGYSNLLDSRWGSSDDRELIESVQTRFGGDAVAYDEEAPVELQQGPGPREYAAIVKGARRSGKRFSDEVSTEVGGGITAARQQIRTRAVSPGDLPVVAVPDNVTAVMIMLPGPGAIENPSKFARSQGDPWANVPLQAAGCKVSEVTEKARGNWGFNAVSRTVTLEDCGPFETYPAFLREIRDERGDVMCRSAVWPLEEGEGGASRMSGTAVVAQRHLPTLKTSATDEALGTACRSPDEAFVPSDGRGIDMEYQVVGGIFGSCTVKLLADNSSIYHVHPKTTAGLEAGNAEIAVYNFLKSTVDAFLPKPIVVDVPTVSWLFLEPRNLSSAMCTSMEAGTLPPFPAVKFDHRDGVVLRASLLSRKVNVKTYIETMVSIADMLEKLHNKLTAHGNLNAGAVIVSQEQGLRLWDFLPKKIAPGWWRSLPATRGPAWYSDDVKVYRYFIGDTLPTSITPKFLLENAVRFGDVRDRNDLIRLGIITSEFPQFLQGPTLQQRALRMYEKLSTGDAPALPSAQAEDVYAFGIMLATYLEYLTDLNKHESVVNGLVAIAQRCCLAETHVDRPKMVEVRNMLRELYGRSEFRRS